MYLTFLLSMCNLFCLFYLEVKTVSDVFYPGGIIYDITIINSFLALKVSLFIDYFLYFGV